MGFKLAELFVDLSVRGASFSKAALGDVKKQLDAMKPAWDGLVTASKAYLAGVTALGVYAVKSYGDAERSAMELEVALESLGAATDDNREKFNAFATDIMRKTVLDDDEVKGLVATAIKLGAQLEDVQNIVRSGIGLGEMYFGGDAKAGIEAITLAQQGNFRALQRLIPELKNASTAQDKLNIVLDKAGKGLGFAEGRAMTFFGQLQRLRVAVGNLAEGFGQTLMPYVKQAADYLHKLTLFLDQATPAQRQFVVQIAAMGAGLAALVVAGPKVFSFMNGLVTSTVSLVKMFWSLGSAIVGIATGPFGLFIGALAVAATATAYWVGTGDTLVERIGNGFATLLEVADVFFGSWNNMWQGWALIVNTTAAMFARGWTYVEYVWEAGLSTMEYLANAWWIGTKGMFEMGWGMLKAGVETFIASVKKLWSDFWNDTTYLAQMAWIKMRGYMPGADKGALQQEALAATGMYRYKQAMNQKDYWTSIADIVNQDILGPLNKAGAEATENDFGFQNRAQEIEDRKNQKLGFIDEQQKQGEADITNKIDSSRVSQKIRDMIAGLKNASGIDDFLKKLKDLQAQVSNMKSQPEKFDPNTALQLQDRSAPGDLKFTGLAEQFKKQVALSMVGEGMESSARKLQEKQLEEQRKTRIASEQSKRALESIVDRIGMA